MEIDFSFTLKEFWTSVGVRTFVIGLRQISFFSFSFSNMIHLIYYSELQFPWRYSSACACLLHNNSRYIYFPRACRCVTRAPVREVSSRPYLLADLKISTTQCILPSFVIAAMRHLNRAAKPGKMHSFIRIWTIGEQVNTRRNLAHWGSLNKVTLFLDKYILNLSMQPHQLADYKEINEGMLQSRISKYIV